MRQRGPLENHLCIHVTSRVTSLYLLPPEQCPYVSSTSRTNTSTCPAPPWQCAHLVPAPPVQNLYIPSTTRTMSLCPQHLWSNIFVPPACFCISGAMHLCSHHLQSNTLVSLPPPEQHCCVSVTSGATALCSHHIWSNVPVSPEPSEQRAHMYPAPLGQHLYISITFRVTP